MKKEDMAANKLVALLTRKEFASRENLQIVDFVTESKTAKEPGRELFLKSGSGKRYIKKQLKNYLNQTYNA